MLRNWRSTTAMVRMRALAAVTTAAALVLSMAGPAQATPARAPATGVAHDIDDSGVIVGYVDDAAGERRAVRWNLDGTVTELRARPGATTSRAYGINARGVIVGESQGLPVQWNTNGTITELAHPQPGVYDPYRINENGFISGWSGGTTAPRPVKWKPGGRIAELPLLPGGRNGQPWGINGSGVIVGDSEILDGGEYEWHAVRWNTDGTITDLAPAGAVGSTAYDINPSGVIVGPSWTADGTWRALRWNADGTTTDLPALPGGSTPYPISINASGVIAGYSLNSAGKWRAVRWTPDGRITALPGLPDSAEDFVWGINRKGVIVGYSVNAAGESRPVRWGPDGRISHLPGL
ncbi:hypothetical protein Misp01_45450 [Microtetraspora sp. NBRC 13810]|uniref:hypothetical protein n=1 Tax=Microtetraspora sp. NBRC 13810 TaxID=3030990 RepID=UPI0024A4B2D8|nr:hypothetical protein [Microtetraspora sp. NBRC 13810]GLW09416.1 hypothetical protein Misp01_45450 [Microtetraspora sp. NBRC 13810]